MTRFVYLLSDYDEDGSQDVVATLDPAKLPEMYDRRFGPDAPRRMNWFDDEAREECKQTMLEWLAKHPDDPACDGLELGSGWGGPQLHVVALE